MRDPRAKLDYSRAKLIGKIFMGTALTIVLIVDIVALMYILFNGYMIILPVYFFIVVPVSIFMLKMILLVPMMILKTIYKNAESIF